MLKGSNGAAECTGGVCREDRTDGAAVSLSAGSGIHRELGRQLHAGERPHSGIRPGGKLAERLDGEIIPSRAFADGGIHEAIADYEDAVFYEILAEELALRDMDGEPMTRENYNALMQRIDDYMGEFEEHGTDRITVDLDE